MRWFTLQYYRILRWVCRSNPEQRRNLKRCTRCNIRFLTVKSNRNQQVICCPFGCRELRSKDKANERSRKHYQTQKGFKKKKELNRKRSLSNSNPNLSTMPTDQIVSNVKPTPLWSRVLLKYIATIVELVVGEKPEIHNIESLLKEMLEWFLRRRPLQERGG